MSRDYAELKEKYFCEMSEKTVNKSDGLFIKSEIQSPVLKEFLNRLESQYGCLLTNVGCTTNNSWLSVKAVAMMVSELDRDLREQEKSQCQ